MDLVMARTANGDQIFFQIALQKGARLPTMNLEILGTSAWLASQATWMTAARSIVVAHHFWIDRVCAGVPDVVLNRVLARQQPTSTFRRARIYQVAA